MVHREAARQSRNSTHNASGSSPPTAQAPTQGSDSPDQTSDREQSPTPPPFAVEDPPSPSPRTRRRSGTGPSSPSTLPSAFSPIRSIAALVATAHPTPATRRSPRISALCNPSRGASSARNIEASWTASSRLGATRTSPPSKKRVLTAGTAARRQTASENVDLGSGDFASSCCRSNKRQKSTRRGARIEMDWQRSSSGTNAPATSGLSSAPGSGSAGGSGSGRRVIVRTGSTIGRPDPVRRSSGFSNERKPLQEIPLWLADSRSEMIRRERQASIRWDEHQQEMPRPEDAAGPSNWAQARNNVTQPSSFVAQAASLSIVQQEADTSADTSMPSLSRTPDTSMESAADGPSDCGAQMPKTPPDHLIFPAARRRSFDEMNEEAEDEDIDSPSVADKENTPTRPPPALLGVALASGSSSSSRGSGNGSSSHASGSSSRRLPPFVTPSPSPSTQSIRSGRASDMAPPHTPVRRLAPAAIIATTSPLGAERERQLGPSLSGTERKREPEEQNTGTLNMLDRDHIM